MGTVEGDQPDETPADAPAASQGFAAEPDQVVVSETKDIGARVAKRIAELPEECTGVDVTNEEGFCIVTFNGRGIEGGAIVEMLVGLTETKVNMVLDFSGVDSVDNIFLTNLFKLEKAFEKFNKLVACCCMSPTIQESFTSIRLEHLFPIHTTRGEAIASFTNPIPPPRIGSR